jgi:hypothetical protein
VTGLLNPGNVASQSAAGAPLGTMHQQVGALGGHNEFDAAAPGAGAGLGPCAAMTFPQQQQQGGTAGGGATAGEGPVAAVKQSAEGVPQGGVDALVQSTLSMLGPAGLQEFMQKMMAHMGHQQQH